MRSEHLLVGRARNRRAPAAWLRALPLLLAQAACSSPKSFVVLTLSSAETAPILDVATLDVIVSQPSSLPKKLTYPPPSGATTIQIDQVTKTDLSVSFAGARSGVVSLIVTARNAGGCAVGTGETSVSIKKGNIATAVVELVAANDCSQADGGAPKGDAFPGCDPVSPACGAGKTCQVNCDSVPQKAECTAGGSGAPGTLCQHNSDCAPGSQCFDYAGTAGCNVKVCLRFCNDDRGCGAPRPDGGSADGGSADAGAAEAGASAGTQSLCAGPVQCGTTTTAYRTCTFACDPRQAAALIGSSATGCPPGLSCLIVGSMDQVDCACAEQTRVKTDGADCTGGAECAPGFICNMMGGSQKCRAICRCDANGMACTAPNGCGPDRSCSALTNDTTFGVCL